MVTMKAGFGCDLGEAVEVEAHTMKQLAAQVEGRVAARALVLVVAQLALQQALSLEPPPVLLVPLLHLRQLPQLEQQRCQHRGRQKRCPARRPRPTTHGKPATWWANATQPPARALFTIYASAISSFLGTQGFDEKLEVTYIRQ